jgi:exodeoxyribonuclease V alpha subunit
MNAAIPERRPATEEISGVIERVTFHNCESGFCVLRVKTPGRRDETTVIGSLPSVTAGEWLAAEGWWVRDKEHGLQFKATTLKTVPPTTAEGIERYLGSGLVKGIGPILAKKLVGRFGADVLVVIEKRPAELQSVDGIGPKRRERIARDMAGGEASPRNHAVPAQPRREHEPSGADIQDLRGAGD